MLMSSELKKFYEKPWTQRLGILAKECNLSKEQIATLKSLKPMDFDTADRMSENVFSVFGTPFSVASNFKINSKDYIVPMASEESSVVAAASNGARLARKAGGFKAECKHQHMTGLISLTNVPDSKKAIDAINANKNSLLEKATSVDKVLKKFGGGAVDLELEDYGEFLECRLVVNVLDAMGANAVNSMCEAVSKDLESLSGGRAFMKIISNYAIKRIARAEAKWLKEDLGEETINGIINANLYAEKSLYRAPTHNKGIMNGIAALAVATGNDFRAISAGAHAFAARDGRYKPLTKYYKDKDGNLIGEIELPMQIGIVGGATKINPLAQISMKILKVKSAEELACVFASLGLAQNFAALRAIVSEGIQRGHMKLHAENIAVQAGAKGDKIKEIAKLMIKTGKVNEEEARNLLGDKK